MSSDERGEDVRAIEAVIARQFASLNWTPEAPPDWDAFAADFRHGASLFPSARPARRQAVEDFVSRMRALAGSKLRSFQERVLGTKVRVFGNIAVAVVACEMTENGTEVNRNVEMLLLIKDDGAWRIVAQAWDKESSTNPIPPYLEKL